MRSWNTQIFWLVLNYDLLKDRWRDDIIIIYFCLFFIKKKKTNRFHVAMGLLSKRSRKSSEGDKNIIDTLRCTLCAIHLFPPHLASSVIYYCSSCAGSCDINFFKSSLSFFSSVQCLVCNDLCTLTDFKLTASLYCLFSVSGAKQDIFSPCSFYM